MTYFVAVHLVFSERLKQNRAIGSQKEKLLSTM